ncbi:hypothetical protein ILYODFUR_031210 [Ilyodon furcidens]|uniref:Uncharacterized protein n=1 Tax=Ilyodon furcidens TaxID=33524 RepID=A0ABV0VB18_9TELE
MAAVSSSGSRVVVFLILVLLSLFCPATSWIDKKDLREMQNDIQKLHQDVARKKAFNMIDLKYIPGLLHDLTHLLKALKKMLTGTVPNFILEFIKEINSVLEETQSFVVEELLNQAANIEMYKEKLTQLETLVTNLAEKNDN